MSNFVRRYWVVLTVVAFCLAIGIPAVIETVHDRDPCRRALALSERTGLDLSDDEDVVSCVMNSAGQDYSATLQVRTGSSRTRSRLLDRSNVGEDPDRPQPASNEHGPRVFRKSVPGESLEISYDTAIEQGLLLTVYAVHL